MESAYSLRSSIKIKEFVSVFLVSISRAEERSKAAKAFAKLTSGATRVHAESST